MGNAQGLARFALAQLRVIRGDEPLAVNETDAPAATPLLSIPLEMESHQHTVHNLPEDEANLALRLARNVQLRFRDNRALESTTGKLIRTWQEALEAIHEDILAFRRHYEELAQTHEEQMLYDTRTALQGSSRSPPTIQQQLAEVSAWYEQILHALNRVQTDLHHDFDEVPPIQVLLYLRSSYANKGSRKPKTERPALRLFKAYEKMVVSPCILLPPSFANGSGKLTHHFSKRVCPARMAIAAVKEMLEQVRVCTCRLTLPMFTALPGQAQELEEKGLRNREDKLQQEIFKPSAARDHVKGPLLDFQRTRTQGESRASTPETDSPSPCNFMHLGARPVLGLRQQRIYRAHRLRGL